MIIDAHTHVWPDKVAHRALSGNGTGFDHVGDGTLAGLRASMAASGVDRSIVLGVANTADAVEKVCRFSASVAAADVVPLGAVHVDLSVEDNLRHLREHRLVGIKVHPLYQGFGLDDPRLVERMDALDPGMLAVVHVGTGGDGKPVAGSTPALLRDLARAVPHVHVIACHFGGYHHLDDAFDVICGSGILVDTSWPPTLGRVDPDRVRDFVRRHGADKVVFASDWPTADPAREIEVMHDLGLGTDETERVLGLNMHELLAPVEARVSAQPG
ncbi:amidohydrolase family protein [Nocardioides hwasunensis]|uniref:Amidohydrolase family protein n=1 Tax=Nocardioides hwasunensis TaxID=397258 RepID=A0ABR8MLY6_9ACTN|nr:amidohydrolase family protein [Nocardioides hwasunensis]MBD3917037.1 amidohydrolase family protein [Nocardioides hwasunensis]